MLYFLTSFHLLVGVWLYRIEVVLLLVFCFFCFDRTYCLVEDWPRINGELFQEVDFVPFLLV